MDFWQHLQVHNESVRGNCSLHYEKEKEIYQILCWYELPLLLLGFWVPFAFTCNTFLFNINELPWKSVWERSSNVYISSKLDNTWICYTTIKSNTHIPASKHLGGYPSSVQQHLLWYGTKTGVSLCTCPNLPWTLFPAQQLLCAWILPLSRRRKKKEKSKVFIFIFKLSMFK